MHSRQSAMSLQLWTALVQLPFSKLGQTPLLQPIDASESSPDVPHTLSSPPQDAAIFSWSRAEALAIAAAAFGSVVQFVESGSFPTILSRSQSASAFAFFCTNCDEVRVIVALQRVASACAGAAANSTATRATESIE